MSELELLATALGVAALAGVNLYLTVFLISLSLRLEWMVLTPELEGLMVLNHPAILWLAGAMTVVEFFADKIPWVDSMWDGVHTVIRPLGATFLGLGMLGTLDPTYAIIAALFCGGIAITSHLSKSGARLLVNMSPEPVSNSVASIIEDIAVIGGLFLIYQYPLVALGLAVIFLTVFIWVAPKLLRFVFATLSCVAAKFKSILADQDPPDQLPSFLSSEARVGIAKSKKGKETSICWSVPVLIGQVPKLPRNAKGYLVMVETGEEGVKEIAIVKSGGRKVVWLPFQEESAIEIATSSKMLHEELTLFDKDTNQCYNVYFFKNNGGFLKKVIEVLNAEFNNR